MGTAASSPSQHPHLSPAVTQSAHVMASSAPTLMLVFACLIAASQAFYGYGGLGLMGGYGMYGMGLPFGGYGMMGGYGLGMGLHMPMYGGYGYGLGMYGRYY